VSEMVRRSVPAILRHAWLLYLALGGVGAGTYLLLSGAAQGTLYNVLGVSAVIALLFGVRRYRARPALPWHVITLGVALFAVGDVIFFNVYPNVLNVLPPFPFGGRRLLRQ
jgi:two-component system cell cycle response regulator